MTRLHPRPDQPSYLVLRHEDPPYAPAAPVSSAPPQGYVAMAEPVYNPPLAAAERSTGASLGHLRVLAPPHLARTVSGSPKRLHANAAASAFVSTR